MNADCKTRIGFIGVYLRSSAAKMFFQRRLKGGGPGLAIPHSGKPQTLRTIFRHCARCRKAD
jgi:hypothetical protein